MKLTNAYASLCRRAASIRRMHSVNAGLLTAAQEFEAAYRAKQEADLRFSAALIAFTDQARRHPMVTERQAAT